MANYSDVNFIKHLLAISEKFIDDQRLGPLHISLYYALFQTWNLSKFRNPISISRSEIMNACKIGSANTYTKCLKELDVWEYIKYVPSHNPHQGSQIYMYNFNKTANNSIDTTTNNSNDKTIVKEPIPYINNTNNTKQKTKVNGNTKNKSDEKFNHSKNSDSELPVKGKSSSAKKEMLAFADTEKSKTKSQQKLREKKKSSAAAETEISTEKEISLFKNNPHSSAQGFQRPLHSETKTYFAQNNWPEKEAEKFHNYYESKGWLIGNAPMVNWNAAANNWMINSIKFANDKKTGNAVKPGGLNTSTDKNYSEPL